MFVLNLYKRKREGGGTKHPPREPNIWNGRHPLIIKSVTVIDGVISINSSVIIFALLMLDCTDLDKRFGDNWRQKS